MCQKIKCRLITLVNYKHAFQKKHQGVFHNVLTYIIISEHRLTHSKHIQDEDHSSFKHCSDYNVIFICSKIQGLSRSQHKWVVMCTYVCTNIGACMIENALCAPHKRVSLRTISYIKKVPFFCRRDQFLKNTTSNITNGWQAQIQVCGD